ncbi:MAG: hypothetical protein IPG12_11460 [Saprospiraceae bacterium]|nr:hypothetical protein [Saprospiraceae bacterium]
MELIYTRIISKPVSHAFSLLYWLLLFQFNIQSLSGLSAQSSCCNILTNGNFESGNSEFSSGLPQNCMCTASSYCIGPNFQSKCSGWPNLNDHTGGGNFLIIDGNSSGLADVWIKTTPITSGTFYCFSFWVASVYNEAFTLGLFVNNTQVTGANFTIQQNIPGWTQFTYNWIASTSGTSISLRQMTGGGLRDFGLDDLEFGSPITLILVFNQTPIVD